MLRWCDTFASNCSSIEVATLNQKLLSTLFSLYHFILRKDGFRLPKIEIVNYLGPVLRSSTLQANRQKYDPVETLHEEKPVACNSLWQFCASSKQHVDRWMNIALKTKRTLFRSLFPFVPVAIRAVSQRESGLATARETRSRRCAGEFEVRWNCSAEEQLSKVGLMREWKDWK